MVRWSNRLPENKEWTIRRWIEAVQCGFNKGKSGILVSVNDKERVYHIYSY